MPLKGLRGSVEIQRSPRVDIEASPQTSETLRFPADWSDISQYKTRLGKVHTCSQTLDCVPWRVLNDPAPAADQEGESPEIPFSTVTALRSQCECE
jgi:hypothetical protein